MLHASMPALGSSVETLEHITDICAIMSLQLVEECRRALSAEARLQHVQGTAFGLLEARAHMAGHGKVMGTWPC